MPEGMKRTSIDEPNAKQFELAVRAVLPKDTILFVSEDGQGGAICAAQFDIDGNEILRSAPSSDCFEPLDILLIRIIQYNRVFIH